MSEGGKRRVAVYGLAKSGLSAIRLLQRQGAQVVAIDQKTPEQLGELAARLSKDGVELSLGQASHGALASVDQVVVSPGVPLGLPVFDEARRAGVEVIGEVELAYRALPKDKTIVGITGTNGKSTTTALCGQLFQAADVRTFVGGNLGTPLSEAALADAPYDAYVVELSSFQLEGIVSFRPTAAVVLNLTPDHLDRYPSHAAYGAAKARIFMNQRPSDAAVVNADDPVFGRFARAHGPVYAFTRTPPGAVTFFAGLAVAEQGGFRLELPPERPSHFTVTSRALRGAHNVDNAMAAALLAKLSKIPEAAIQRGLDEFPGLPHRLEYVATVDGVEWVNDSKATNVDSSLVALRAFTQNVWLILGGKGKGAPYQPLVDEAAGKVKGILTVGQDAPTISRAFEGRIAVHGCETLQGAVEQARRLSRAGDVVLLSPACASYDQFQNFEHRGDVFKALVRGLS